MYLCKSPIWKKLQVNILQRCKKVMNIANMPRLRLRCRKKRRFGSSCAIIADEDMNLTSTEELFDRVDAFERDYREWKKNPLVTEFLDAELAFCRMMQEANMQIMDAMDFE